MLTSAAAVTKDDLVQCVGAVFTPTTAIFLKSCVLRCVIDENNEFLGYFIRLPLEFIPQGIMPVTSVKYRAGFSENVKPYSIIIVSK